VFTGVTSADTVTGLSERADFEHEPAKVACFTADQLNVVQVDLPESRHLDAHRVSARRQRKDAEHALLVRFRRAGEPRRRVGDDDHCTGDDAVVVCDGSGEDCVLALSEGARRAGHNDREDTNERTENKTSYAIHLFSSFPTRSVETGLVMTTKQNALVFPIPDRT